MAIQREIWRPDIIEFLERDNEFMRMCVNADEYVVQGKIVHIPQAGTAANIERNRASLPAPITKRTDTDITYTLNEYTSDPILLPDADTKQLSYDKRQSVLRSKFAKMREFVANDMLYEWARNIPAANKLKTTGSSTHTATAPGGTSTRKNLIEADLRAAAKLLNKANVSRDGRYILVDSALLDQLYASLTAAQLYAFKDSVDVKTGIIGKLWGFNIMERSNVLVFDSSDAIKLQEAAGATGDNVAALFWQMDMVERAYGDINLFEQLGAPEFYGDIYSCNAYLGGRARREDNIGVGVLIADA